MSCDHDMALGTCPECDDYGRSTERQAEEGPVVPFPGRRTAEAWPYPSLHAMALRWADRERAAGVMNIAHPSVVSRLANLLSEAFDMGEMQRREGHQPRPAAPPPSTVTFPALPINEDDQRLVDRLVADSIPKGTRPLRASEAQHGPDCGCIECVTHEADTAIRGGMVPRDAWPRSAEASPAEEDEPACTCPYADCSMHGDAAVEVKLGSRPASAPPEAASEDVLRMVHAFDDQGRKSEVRALAARVRRVEDERDRWLAWAAENQELHERASRAAYERRLAEGRRRASVPPDPTAAWTVRGRCAQLLRSTGWLDGDSGFLEMVDALLGVLERRTDPRSSNPSPGDFAAAVATELRKLGIVYPSTTIALDAVNAARDALVTGSAQAEPVLHTAQLHAFLAGYDAGRQNIEPNEAFERWSGRCASSDDQEKTR